MKALFSLFWQICLLRRGPQDVPYAAPLLGLLIVVAIGLDALSIPLLSAFAIPQTGPATSSPSAMVQMAALLVMLGGLLLAVYLILRFKNLQSRYVQTMSAALGTELIISVPQILVELVMVSTQPGSPMLSLIRVTLWVLYIWDILVKGHIYSQAMNIGRIQANLLAFTLWFGLLALGILLVVPSPN